MPGYQAHIFGGLAAGGLAAAGAATLGYLDKDPMVVGLALSFCVLGALFPDVDTDSKGQGLFYCLLFAVNAVLISKEYYKWAAWLGTAAMLPAIGHHRGWTHTWWAALLVPTPILVIPHYFLALPWQRFLPLYAAFVIGYLSHLVLDGKYK